MSMKKLDQRGHAMLQQPLMLLVFCWEVTLERVVSIEITCVCARWRATRPPPSDRILVFAG
jgi:hypothetical protein